MTDTDQVAEGTTNLNLEGNDDEDEQPDEGSDSLPDDPLQNKRKASPSDDDDDDDDSSEEESEFSDEDSDDSEEMEALEKLMDVVKTERKVNKELTEQVILMKQSKANPAKRLKVAHGERQAPDSSTDYSQQDLVANLLLRRVKK
jgi:hypothetical protein